MITEKTQKDTVRRVTEEEFLAEIGEAVKEYFVGTVRSEDKALSVILVGGQKFMVSVKEVA